MVGLQVTSADGAIATQRRTVLVDTAYALPRPDSARLLSPFPVVTLVGRLTPRERASSGSRSARRCARASASAALAARAQSGVRVRGRRPVRIRRFERSCKPGPFYGTVRRTANRQEHKIPHPPQPRACTARLVPQAGRDQGVQMPWRLTVLWSSRSARPQRWGVAPRVPPAHLCNLAAAHSQAGGRLATKDAALPRGAALPAAAAPERRWKPRPKRHSAPRRPRWSRPRLCLPRHRLHLLPSPRPRWRQAQRRRPPLSSATAACAARAAGRLQQLRLRPASPAPQPLITCSGRAVAPMP